MARDPHTTAAGPKSERALLIGLVLPDSDADREDPLGELALLAKTAGACVVGKVSQRARHFNASTYIGSGKAQDARALVAELDASVVICDHDLSTGQVRNLERLLDCKVIDRSELILDIFATHARTNQAKLQVEVAQLEYMLPRLIGMWTHFERPEGAIGTRGPGETQLETDRRLVNRRLAKLKRELAKIETRIARQVRARDEIFTVSLVGYTNAGKSSLMHALTGADVLIQNKLFATLDTKSVRWEVQPNRFAVLSDTVGFIRRLPHHLVASFHATLEEATRADLLLHVADASHPHCEEQMANVLSVLDEVGCGERPMLTVLNKVDVVVDEARLALLASEHPDHVMVSAKRGDGLADLSEWVVRAMSGRFAEIRVRAPLSDGRTRAFLRATAQIVDETTEDGHVEIAAVIDRQHLGQLRRLTERVDVRGE
jgi:GTP-binding protein HflX